MAILASDIILLARTLTDHDSDTQITDTQLLALLNTRYEALCRALGMVVPTLRTKVAATFTVSSGNSQDVTAAPLFLTDFDRVRRIRRQVSAGVWDPIGVASPIDPETIPQEHDFVFLERGTVIEFYPSLLVVGQTFELSYVYRPVRLASTASALDIPDGADDVLAQQLAALIRGRFDEDPSAHVAEAARLWTDLKWYLQRRYGVHPEGMADQGVR